MRSTQKPLRLAFRADASAAIGVGHVMRSITLAAAAVTRGHLCELFAAECPRSLIDRAERRGVRVIKVMEPAGSAADAAAMARQCATAVCVDGYQFGSVFMDTLISQQRSVMVIDDNREVPLGGVALILNQNPHAISDMYSDVRGTTCLLGLDYALVRPEVRAACRRGSSGQRGRVLVSIGGADVADITSRLVESLLAKTDLLLDVAIGLVNPREHRVRALISEHRNRVAEVAGEHLLTALAQSELAIIGAGATLWEAAALGVPALSVIVADNQAPLAATATVRSFSRVHDARTEFSPDQVAREAAALMVDHASRATMSESGRALVDGHGPDRAVDALEQLLAPMEIEPHEG